MLGEYGNKEQRPKRRESEWVPKTTLGALVKEGKITSLDDIFYHSLRIRESEIVDHLLGKECIFEEILSRSAVQKQGKAGEKTSMKVCVAVGNKNGYIGVGTYSSREMDTALRGAIRNAKMNIIPVRMGQWDGFDNLRNTIACKASGKCGSVVVKLMPAPMGIGIAFSRVERKMLELAGIKDIKVQAFGRTSTTENFAKAILNALYNSSSMYIPDQWNSDVKLIKPSVEFASFLNKIDKVKVK